MIENFCPCHLGYIFCWPLLLWNVSIIQIGGDSGESNILPICDHISYRTAVLCEMVRWWGVVRLMGRANLNTACVWFLNIELVWRLCQTLHCLMIYHFTLNLSSGKCVCYSHNLYTLGICLWVYCRWCIIMFLIMLIKWQRLCNVKWGTKTAISS
jgi:hypothetical protein